MIRALVVMLIAAIGISCALAVDRMRIQLNHANSVIAARDQTIKEKDEVLTAERAWSASRESVIKAMLTISTDIETIRTTVRTQRQESKLAFEELLKNDKVVRDYLNESVPDNLGMLYERPATTDPTKYRSGGSVPSGAVPAPSQKGSKIK